MCKTSWMRWSVAHGTSPGVCLDLDPLKVRWSMKRKTSRYLSTRHAGTLHTFLQKVEKGVKRGITQVLIPGRQQENHLHVHVLRSGSRNPEQRETNEQQPNPCAWHDCSLACCCCFLMLFSPESGFRGRGQVSGGDLRHYPPCWVWTRAFTGEGFSGTGFQCAFNSHLIGPLMPHAPLRLIKKRTHFSRTKWPHKPTWTLYCVRE